MLDRTVAGPGATSAPDAGKAFGKGARFPLGHGASSMAGYSADETLAGTHRCFWTETIWEQEMSEEGSKTNDPAADAPPPPKGALSGTWGCLGLLVLLAIIIAVIIGVT